MRPLVVLARPLLAYGFVTGGIQALKDPSGLVGMSERVGVPEPGRVVPVTSTVMVAAGTAMALGVRPRTSALTLAGCLTGFTWTLHGFWRETEERPRRAKRQAFVTNAGTLGGLLAVAAASSRD